MALIAATYVFDCIRLIRQLDVQSKCVTKLARKKLYTVLAINPNVTPTTLDLSHRALDPFAILGKSQRSPALSARRGLSRGLSSAIAVFEVGAKFFILEGVMVPNRTPCCRPGSLGGLYREILPLH